MPNVSIDAAFSNALEATSYWVTELAAITRCQSNDDIKKLSPKW
jgi:hypothetical protein